MRILIYGGCHAQILSNLLRLYVTEPGFTVDYLLNYDIIASSQPFPYERLSSYDAVVYSPVRRDTLHNTRHLVEECRQRKIRTLSYPWLQWNGGHPTAVKKRDIHWLYPKLVTERKKFESLESYRIWVDTDAFTDAELDERLDWSFDMLRKSHEEPATDIGIYDFVRGNYKQHVLFKVPHHPTAMLYRYVLHEIADRLGFTLDPAIDGMNRDLHPSQTMPILKRARERYGIECTHGDYVSSPAFGPFPYTELDFLRMHYHADSDTIVAVSEYTGKAHLDYGSFETAPLQALYGRLLDGDRIQIIDGLNLADGHPILQATDGDWKIYPLKPLVDRAMEKPDDKDHILLNQPDMYSGS